MDNLKYRVSIPKRNRGIPGRITYCHEHIGKEFVDWQLTYAEDYEIADTPYVYYFKNEDDAVMFKLIYG